MKQRICSLFLALVLLLSLAVPAAAAGAMPFTDVKESDWFYSYVKTMYDNELVSGTTPTTFSPQDTVTLGEALKFILNAAGYTAPTTSGKNWASGYYQLAQEKGFLNSSWSLGLNDAMNRLQIAELIVNVLGVERKQQTASPFTDTSDVAALILSDHGIFEGTTERDGKTYFYPQRNISRAEISTDLRRTRSRPPTSRTIPRTSPTTPAPSTRMTTIPSPPPASISTTRAIKCTSPTTSPCETTTPPSSSWTRTATCTTRATSTPPPSASTSPATRATSTGRR